MTIAMILVALSAVAPRDTIPPPQGVDYRIEASLDEATDVLTGRARLKYVNRSEERLDTLWFHQHLNAFRPSSAWARRELEYGQRRFQDLGPDDHAFERFTAVTVDGRASSPVYPGAPDSTVVGIPLPASLNPGDSVTVVMDWQARLSTTPRRQGRLGRHFDFAQWYPRIAVYEDGSWQTQPLLPQGEFYGEFATYDVTLDVVGDQVIGSTGVPVAGDPGWEGAAAAGGGPVDMRREAYAAGAEERLGLLPERPAQGRKQVRWRAEDVHHFAWSADPDYVYEGGQVERIGGDGGSIALHVLYLPADTSWDDGVALERTQRALTWLQELWGPYLWPQLTNLHRIESGGTEFPMLLMDGSASEGLILHEAGHQYLHGMLANNEWREGWMDEGFQSFVDDWAAEERAGAAVWEGSMRAVRQLEAAGRSQPIALPGAEFADPTAYSLLTYTKPSLVLRMLRELVGEDTMREILREYFRRHALSHVSEEDLRQAVRDVTGEDYDWFFDQWIHSTATLDYSVAAASTEPADNSRWRTRVTVRREGDAWMPVTVRVGAETRVLTGREAEQVVVVETTVRPQEVVVDPDGVLLDMDPANNRRGL